MSAAARRAAERFVGQHLAKDVAKIIDAEFAPLLKACEQLLKVWNDQGLYLDAVLEIRTELRRVQGTEKEN